MSTKQKEINQKRMEGRKEDERPKIFQDRYTAAKDSVEQSSAPFFGS
jgi:hypothetical protein